MLACFRRLRAPEVQYIKGTDTFNALNEPALRGPTTDPTNSSFGKITAQEPARSFQFSLNLQF